jgi:uncharacterized protein (DUF4415 family)
MRKSYDFSAAKPNPYARKLKQQVTLRLDASTLEWFKNLSQETAIPYQTLINMYLRDCATKRKHLQLEWQPAR